LQASAVRVKANLFRPSLCELQLRKQRTATPVTGGAVMTNKELAQLPQQDPTERTNETLKKRQAKSGKHEACELTDEQLADLVSRLLGPEEEWDDAAAEFVLEVYGIDPTTAGSYVKKMLENIIRQKQEQGERPSQMLLDILKTFEAAQLKQP
jgi:3'-phosphoadenosine 5'-phosphosulfate (PAPS) 3'-phosphatase